MLVLVILKIGLFVAGILIVLGVALLGGVRILRGIEPGCSMKIRIGMGRKSPAETSLDRGEIARETRGHAGGAAKSGRVEPRLVATALLIGLRGVRLMRHRLLREDIAVRIMGLAHEPGQFGQRIFSMMVRVETPLEIVKIDRRALFCDGLAHTLTSFGGFGTTSNA